MRRLQPNAVMFSDAGPDIRRIGNERGVAGSTNWSTVDPSIVTYPGMSGDEVMRSLQDGDATGTVWRPGETDVSIRPGWFYHPAEDGRVKSEDDLVELYFTSVGRNSKLLLNVPPTQSGVLHEVDVARLARMRSRLAALFSHDLAAGRSPTWRTTGARSAVAEVELRRASTIRIADLREDVARGQVVARYLLEGFADGGWRELSRGTTIGYRRLDRFAPVTLRRVRLTVHRHAGHHRRKGLGRRAQIVREIGRLAKEVLVEDQLAVPRDEQRVNERRAIGRWIGGSNAPDERLKLHLVQAGVGSPSLFAIDTNRR